MATTTNFSWATPDDSANVKDGAAAIRSLGTAVDTTVATMVPKTVVDAKGDLIAATAADTVSRLAVGANGTTLVADSSEATGLKWAAPAAGGMTLIQETVANADTSIVFSSIAGTYKQLYLQWSGLNCSTNATTFNIRFNNSSSSEYAYQTFGAYNQTATVRTLQGTSTVFYFPLGAIGEACDLTNLYERSAGYILIDNYASSTKTKFATGFRTQYFNAGLGEQIRDWSNVVWNNTNAITSIDIVRTAGAGTMSNATNTSIRLYGIS